MQELLILIWGIQIQPSFRISPTTMYFSPQLQDHTPVFGSPSTPSPPTPPPPFFFFLLKHYCLSPGYSMKVKGFTPLENHNTAIDHALNLAYKPIHCNNRMEINGQILSCNHQLSSIKIRPAAWPLSTDPTLRWLTQFPLALRQAGNSWGVGKPQQCLLLPRPRSRKAGAQAARLAACLPAREAPGPGVFLPDSHITMLQPAWKTSLWKPSFLPTVVWPVTVLDRS